MALPFAASRLVFLVVTLSAGWWRNAVGLARERITDPWHERIALATGTPLDHWLQWDAFWYLHIAAHGYAYDAGHHSSVAFFPLYPLLVHWAAWLPLWAHAASPPLGGGLLIAAMALSNGATAVGLAVLYRIVAGHGDRQWARRVIIVACAFPTAMFTAAAYSEGLFLLTTALFFLALQKGQWGSAALWGAAAALCRPLGLALAPCYALALWQSKDWHRGCSTARLVTALGALAPLAGSGAYAGYLGWAFGHPLAFGEAQRTWHRTWTWPWTALSEGARRPLAHLPALTPTDWHALSDFGLTVALLVVCLATWRSLRPEQALYLGLFWALTLCSPAVLDGYAAPLSSVPRFAVVIVPLLLALAYHRRVAWVAVAGGALWLTLNVALFVNGAWVA